MLARGHALLGNAPDKRVIDVGGIIQVMSV